MLGQQLTIKSVKVLAASLHKPLTAHWSLHRETHLSQTLTGLVSETQKLT